VDRRTAVTHSGEAADGGPELSRGLDKHAIKRLTRRRLVAVILRSLLSVGSYGCLVIIGSLDGTNLSWILIWPLLGVILFGFSAAAHECIHGNFASSRNLNHLAGAAWMTPLLLNYTVHKQIHLRHHANATMAGDPERAAEPTKFNSAADYVAAILPKTTILKPLYLQNWRASLAAFVSNSAGGDLVDNVRFDSVALVVWLTMTIVATVLHPALLISGYWIPVIFFAPTAFTLLSLPEHYQTTACKDPLLNTRTIVSTRLMRMLIWNINYHTAHHFHPKVPFHALPALDQMIAPMASFRERSYLLFHLGLLRPGRRAGPRSGNACGAAD
jgi:fatty acid desaturase